MSSLSLWGQFERTRPAMLAFALSGCAAVGTCRSESLGRSRDGRAVDILVASAAQGDTVHDIVAQFTVMFPRFDVVSLYLTSGIALLARIVVALVNGISPQAIFVAIASLVGVLLARCERLAIAGAILDFEMTTCREKLTAAAPTDKGLPSAALSGKFTAATAGASRDGYLVAEPTVKAYATDNAVGFVALNTILLTRVCCFKGAVAYGAQLIANRYGWPVTFAGRVPNAELGFAFDLSGAVWMRAFLARCHATIIPLFERVAELDRWATATGKTPVLLK